MNTHHTFVQIQLEDEFGIPQKIVPVDVYYVIDVDDNYGADADGRRGVRKEEVIIIGMFTDPCEYFVDAERAKAQVRDRIIQLTKERNG